VELVVSIIPALVDAIIHLVEADPPRQSDADLLSADFDPAGVARAPSPAKWSHHHSPRDVAQC